MSRIDDILTSSRDIIADPDGDRWSDAQLLRFLNEAQKEAVLYAGLLRTKESTPILVGVSEYSVPSDCFRIIRILIDGEVAPIYSHAEMDDMADKGEIGVSDTGWEDYEAETVTHIVFDKLNYNKYRIYPIPEEGSPSSFTLAAATQVPEDTTYDPIYGVSTAATGYTTNSNYGFTVDMSDDYTNTFVDSTTGLESVYGLMTMFEDDAKGLTVYYLKRPDAITATTDTLEIDEFWDTALQHYVSGKALMCNKDTEDRALAQVELQLFAGAVQDMKRITSENTFATKRQYREVYNDGFNS